ALGWRRIGMASPNQEKPAWSEGEGGDAPGFRSPPSLRLGGQVDQARHSLGDGGRSIRVTIEHWSREILAADLGGVIRMGRAADRGPGGPEIGQLAFQAFDLEPARPAAPEEPADRPGLPLPLVAHPTQL